MIKQKNNLSYSLIDYDFTKYKIIRCNTIIQNLIFCLVFILLSNVTLGQSYCSSSGNMSYYTGVTLVNFNAINNSSAKPSGYNNYTAQSTNLLRNSSYDITVNVNTDGNYTIYARVWIDWNNNGDFTDSGDQFSLGSKTNSSNGATSGCPYSITVPATAALGNIRMRVSAKYNAYPSSCETSFDGEVEDYTLNISDPAPPTYPGGVTGATLWLKANAGTSSTSEGGTVSTWSDQSSGGNHATTTVNSGWTNPGSNPPVFRTGSSSLGINFNPSVDFSGDKSLDGIAGLSTKQVFVVLKNPTSGRDIIGFDDADGGGGGAQSGIVYWTTSLQCFARNTTGNNYFGSYVSHSIPTSQPFIFDGQHITSTTGSLLINGSGTTVPNNLGTPPSPFTGAYRINKTSDNQYPANGQIAEIISYNSNLSSTDRQRVITYLAIKYSISLNQTVPQNYIASDGTTIYWNGTTNSTYKNNLTAIVRDDTTALHQKQAKSGNAGLQVAMGHGNTIAADNNSNTNDITVDKSALIWGDDNGSVAAWTTTGAPTGTQIIPRIWKTQETGTVGSVKVQVADYTGSNGLPSGTTCVALLVDADGDFTSGSTLVAMTLNGTNWECNYDFSNAQFFTFSTNYVSMGNPVFGLGATSSRCQATGSVTYTATATNATSISYSLDATSLGAGNSINSSTGEVTYVVGWSGTSTITATANGCAFPTNSDHVVTITANPTITGTTPGSRCGTGTVSLGATASAGTINWYAASTGGSSLGTGTSFTTPSISSTTTYWVDATISGCTTTSRTSIEATVTALPTITGTTPGERCLTGTVNLGATASAGTINWYAASTGGSSLGTGTSFTTPSISSTTTYWVDATNNGCTTASRTSVLASVNSSAPDITGTTPGSRFGTGTVNLGATASYGTINWYAASTGGSSLGTGTSFTTPSISTTTTYWADATSGGCTTASRTAIVATVNNSLPLYLSDPSQALDRIDPVATGDLTTSSVTLGSSPVVDNTTTGSSGNPNSTTFTVSHTTGTGSYRLMLVGISQKNKEVTSVKYGNTSLTLVGENTSSGNARMHLYSLINPPSGTADVEVTLSANPDKGIVVGVTTFTNVNQSTPFGSFNSDKGNNSLATVNVTSATGEVVYDVATYRNTTMTADASQSVLYNINTGGEIKGGGASTKPGAASITMSWAGAESKEWAIGAVSIKPAVSTVSFTQTPTLCSNFTINAGTITVTNYVSINSGSMPPSPNITAVLRYGSTNIITLNNPSYSGGILTWTGTLGSNVTVPSGQAITLDVTSAESGVSFNIDYDSQTKPSRILLYPTSSLNVDQLEFYDAPYPGGSLITSKNQGQTVYIRAVASSPFGNADITGMTFKITDPLAGINTVSATEVATSGCTKFYEYTWNIPNTTGNYQILATASQGTEGIYATNASSFNVAPTITGTTPGSRCGTGTVSLGATASAGTINWYAASTGGSSLGTGTSFTTPSISSNTTYWVDATDNGITTTSRTSVLASITNSLSGIQNIVCPNETVNYSLACSYDSVVWTITGGTPTSSNSPTINVTWGTGNRGWVKVEKFNSGVSQGFDSARIYIDQVSQFTATPNSTICNGANINLGLTYTNKSLQLNGTSDYVGISNSNLINLGVTDYRTVMIWFKPNDVTTRQVIYNEGGGVNGLSIYIENGNVYCLVWESNTPWTPTVTAISVGQWYHICFVFDQDATDGNHFKGYLNGTLIAAYNEGSKADNGINSHSGSVEIGNNLANIRFHDNSRSSDNYFNGYVDGFKLWNRSLKAEEIPLEQYHWLSTPVIDAALDVYINFDNTVLDQANPPSGEDGALYGTPVYSDDVPLKPSLLWTPGNFTTQTINVSPTVTTNYQVKLTETLSNYCADSTTIIVSVNPSPTITGSTPGYRCGTGTVSLSATASAGTVNWYSAATGGTLLGTGTSFTTPSISTTTSYWAEAFYNGCPSVTRTEVIATINNTAPTITGTTPNTRCGSGSVTLSATASAGTVNWYTASTGGSAVDTGTTFNTPSISSTTTYWVDATYLGCTTASRTSVVATVNSNPIGVTATVGTSFACYTTLKTAFDAINAGTHQGVINILVGGNTTETSSAVLNASGSGSANYSSININPDGGDERIITANINGRLIDLSGADNVTIDGLNTSGNSLTISNTSTGTSASTIRFLNDASDNTIQNCTILGSGTSASLGTINFSTTTGTTGNDNNIISNNTISAAGSNLPVNAIFSLGTSAKENSDNSILNNNISDFFQAGIASNGIYLSSYNISWTISDNKLFQSATRVTTASTLTHRAIQVVGGDGHVITNNIIGYANENGTGVTSYTIGGGSTTPLYRAIEITAGVTTATSVQNNTITAISLSTNNGTATLPGIFSGIYVLAGKVDIGTITGNTIGATTGNAAISVVSTITLGLVTGIYATSVSTVNIQNNKIGGFDLGDTDPAIGYSFHAISTAGTNGIFDISNNTIGSLTTANSISTGSTQTTTGVNTFIGIRNAATGAITIENNIIQNCTSYGTAASAFYGIDNNAGSGTLNINSNQLIASTITGTGTFAGLDNAAVVATCNINNNIIRNIVRTAASGSTTIITSAGAITSALNIMNNQLGNASYPLIDFTVANSGTLTGVLTSAATNASALTITGNNIQGINYAVLSTAANTYISNAAVTLSQNISNNTFTDLNIKSTGAIIFITNSVALPSGGTETTNNNSIVGTFTRDATSGAITLYTNAATSNANSTSNFSNNNFSNITISGAATISGAINTDAGTSTKIVDGNTFSNWQGGTGAITALSVNLTGSGNQTKNNIIQNIQCACSIIGITTGTGNDNIFSNTIDTLISTGGVVATIITGINVSAGTTKNIYSNSISNITGNTLTTGSVRGIAVSGGTTINVYQNTIFGISTTATTTGSINGIWVSGSTTASLYKNKIYDIYTTSTAVTTGIVYGIQLSGTTASTTRNLINNFIGDLRAEYVNSTTDVVRGVGIISTGATSNINLHYNTIYLNATSSGTNFSTTCVYHTANATATTARLEMLNNILSNNSTPNGSGIVVAFRRSSASANTLNNYKTTSNNNLFYAGVPSTTNLIFYTSSTNNAQTLTQYKQGVFTAGTIDPRDQLSVSEDMLSTGAFLSTDGADPDFLRISPTAVTLVESGGVNISGITDDQEGTIRHGNPGYSGTGTNPDIGADEVDSYVITSLSGTYNVGTGQTFTSLTRGGAIFSLINNRGLSGNVIINITSDLSENGVEPLSQWTEYGGSGYTITIKSSAAVVRNITGTVNNGLIRFNGADRVLVDGSVGGSGRYLRFSNTNTGTSAATFTFLNDASNDTIKNCIIEGSTTNSVGGVVFFSTTTATTGNDNNVVT